MSKLEELIQQYCPDGVEYQTVKDICLIKEKGSIVKKDLTEEGYPVVNSAREILGFYPEYNNVGDTLVITSHGAYAGFCHYLDVEFYAGSLCYPIQSKNPDAILTKYLYYFFSNIETLIRDKYVNKSGVPYVNFKQFQTIEVPVPALPVQREIVRILDEFSLLSAELAAELAARKKQYAYYLNEVLSFANYDGDLNNKTIGEMCSVGTGSKPSKILDSPADFDYINAGTSRSGYCNEFNRDGDVTTTPSRGQGGIGYVGYQNKAFWLGPLCYAIRSDKPDLLINKYIFYWLSAHSDLILQYKNEGGTPSLNKSDLESIKISFPDITEQKRIVNILDYFKSLTEDLYSGIPAEIEARQKQYEYYREKLLTFKRKES